MTSNNVNNSSVLSSAVNINPNIKAKTEKSLFGAHSTEITGPHAKPEKATNFTVSNKHTKNVSHLKPGKIASSVTSSIICKVVSNNSTNAFKKKQGGLDTKEQIPSPDTNTDKRNKLNRNIHLGEDKFNFENLMNQLNINFKNEKDVKVIKRSSSNKKSNLKGDVAGGKDKDEAITTNSIYMNTNQGNSTTENENKGHQNHHKATNVRVQNRNVNTTEICNSNTKSNQKFNCNFLRSNSNNNNFNKILTTNNKRILSKQQDPDSSSFAGAGNSTVSKLISESKEKEHNRKEKKSVNLNPTESNHAQNCDENKKFATVQKGETEDQINLSF